MLRPERRSLRALRALTMGLAVGAVTVMAHGAGHGQPSTLSVIVVILLAIAVADLLAMRRLRFWLLLAYAVGFQAVGHWLLLRMSPTSNHAGQMPAHTAMVDGSGSVAMDATGRYTRVTVDTAEATGDASVFLLGQTPAMAGSHAVAAVLLAWLFLRHENGWYALCATLERTAALVFGRFADLIPCLPPLPRGRWSPVESLADPLSQLTLHRAHRWRGPPLRT